MNDRAWENLLSSGHIQCQIMQDSQETYTFLFVFSFPPGFQLVKLLGLFLCCSALSVLTCRSEVGDVCESVKQERTFRDLRYSVIAHSRFVPQGQHLIKVALILYTL